MRAEITLTTPDRPVKFLAEGAVFDCDGLLFDSESVWLDMISDWLAEHALEFPDINQLIGVDATTAARILVDQLQAAQHPRFSALSSRTPSPTLRNALRIEITDELDADYSARLSSGVPVMPGAADLLKQLSSIIPVAVASNGRRTDVMAMLRSADLDHLLHSVCTVEDVAEGKPAPDLYVRAAALIGVAPKDCAAFEDSRVGTQAARAAGTTVVGVNADHNAALVCDYRLTSLRHVSATPAGNVARLAANTRS